MATTQLISMDPAKWYIRYSIGMPRHPTAVKAGWWFTFPKYEDNSLNKIDYLMYYPYQKKIVQKQITMEVAITATNGTIFDFKTEESNTGTKPAHVRFLLRGGTGGMSNDRWWSNPGAIKLEPIHKTLIVNLTPDLWSNVNGKKGTYSTETLAGFQKVLDTPIEIGMTFGGGLFFGHGVRTKNGTATFSCINYNLIN